MEKTTEALMRKYENNLEKLEKDRDKENTELERLSLELSETRPNWSIKLMKMFAGASVTSLLMALVTLPTLFVFLFVCSAAGFLFANKARVEANYACNRLENKIYDKATCIDELNEVEFQSEMKLLMEREGEKE